MGLKIEFQRVEEDEEKGQEETVSEWKFEWTKKTTKIVVYFLLTVGFAFFVDLLLRTKL